MKVRRILMSEHEQPTIDQNRLAVMKVAIIDLERKNLKTREKNDDEMIKAIRRIIESESMRTF